MQRCSPLREGSVRFDIVVMMGSLDIIQLYPTHPGPIWQQLGIFVERLFCDVLMCIVICDLFVHRLCGTDFYLKTIYCEVVLPSLRLHFYGVSYMFFGFLKVVAQLQSLLISFWYLLT